MKQYVIDELRPNDYEQLKVYCDANLECEPMAGLYRVPMAPELLTKLQRTHTDCHPLFFALELLPERFNCELLVRTHSRIRCDCMGYATSTQRNWLIDQVDAILEKLDLEV